MAQGPGTTPLLWPGSFLPTVERGLLLPLLPDPTPGVCPPLLQEDAVCALSSQDLKGKGFQGSEEEVGKAEIRLRLRSL